MGRKWALVAGLAVAALAVGLLALPLFLPEQTTRLDEDTPGADGTEAVVPERRGDLRGEEGHRASGAVLLLQVDGAWYLRFEDLDMTSGPDIHLYLIGSEGSTRQKVEAGAHVPVVTQQDESPRINERGTFNVALPPGVDPGRYGGISVWCERFGVAFATAPLD